MTPLQAATARALVCVFETGQVRPPYGQVDALPGERGHLVYGATRAALADGGLTRLVQTYLGRDGARHAKAFQLFVNTLRDRNPALITDRYFHNLLRTAADDPVMRAIQDEIETQTHWDPAMAEAERRGIDSPLGRAVVYDAFVHGSWENIRRKTNKAHDKIEECGEPSWIAAYVAQRSAWLGEHRRPAWRQAAYRMTALGELVRLGNWDLRLPLVIRDRVIDRRSLDATPPGTYDGPSVGTRPLSLTEPLMRGGDVRQVQLALCGLTVGRHVTADGIYGPQTEDAVRSLQDMLSYPVTGIVDEVAFDALDL